jgi:hypothetical protein
MWRAIAIALVLGAGLAAAPGPTAAGTPCANRLSWHGAAYRQQTTRGDVPLGQRLGTGRLTSLCRTTHATAPLARTAVQRSVYAVDGIRPSVAVAIAGRRPVLFVSRRSATTAEIRVLNRIRSG